MNDDEDDDEFAWTNLSTGPLHQHLKALEQSLRCSICASFLRNPVLLKQCGHTFCSYCLRHHIRCGLSTTRRTAECPSCRATIQPIEADTGKDLFPNAGLEQAVHSFQALRSLLLQRLKNTENDNADTTRRTSPRSVMLQQDNHNPHPPPTQEAPRERRKKLPKLSYTSQTAKQLKTLLQDVGITTRAYGETDLKRLYQKRHYDYITLYNAECDSSNPKTVQQIVEELNRAIQAQQEAAQQEQWQGTAQDKLHIRNVFARRNSTDQHNNDITSGNAAFDRKFQSNFKDLIRNYQQQNNNKKKNARDEIVQDTPHDKHLTTKSDVDRVDGFEESGDTKVAAVAPDSTTETPEPMLGQHTVESTRHFLSLASETTPSESHPATLSNNNMPHTTENDKDDSVQPLEPAIPATQRNSKKRKSPLGMAAQGPWACTICTFINHSTRRVGSRLQCSMCRQFQSMVHPMHQETTL